MSINESFNAMNFHDSSSSTLVNPAQAVHIVAKHDQYNFLPSYQMHEAILSNPPPTQGVLQGLPPHYGEVSSPGSNGIDQSMGHEYGDVKYGSCEDLVSTCGTDSCFSPSSRPNSETSSIYESSPARQIHSLLYNALSYQPEPLPSKSLSDSISIEIHLTSEACIPGTRPKVLSPEVSNYYTTGDYIYGFVICENLSVAELPFSMFHVLLEGNVVRTDSKTKLPEVINFLQSVDLSASFNYSVEEGLMYDPFDNTKFFFSKGRILEPGVRYKRYFSFKVPEELLDYQRKEDGLIMQIQLPPSLDPEALESLSLNDNKIEYSVVAKLIGKDPQQKRLFTIRDCTKNVTIIPQTSEESLNSYHREEMNAVTKSIEENAEYYIKLGRQLRKLIPADMSSRVKSQDRIDKMNPSSSLGYSQTELMPSPNHRTILPIKMKKLFGAGSIDAGLLKVFVLTMQHEVKFIAHNGLRATEILKKDLDTWKINVPVSLRYLPKSDNKIPEITNVSASIECVSYVNDKYKLPIEIDFDYLFNNETGEELPSLLIKKFKKLNYDLLEQVREVNMPQEFGVEVTLLQDLRAISTIKTKKSTLNIGDVTIDSLSNLNSKALPWRNEKEGLSFSSKKANEIGKSKRDSKRKDLNITIDLASAHLRSSTEASALRSFDKYSLVPSFQNCYIGRIYCLKVTLEFLQGSTSTTRIPITITN